MLGDISSYRATKESEGKQSILLFYSNTGGLNAKSFSLSHAHLRTAQACTLISMNTRQICKELSISSSYSLASKLKENDICLNEMLKIKTNTVMLKPLCVLPEQCLINKNIR